MWRRKLSRTAKPLVSIVTPVHNGETFIADTVRTVCNQTQGDWEWIVVDDNSSDMTLAKIEEAKRKIASQKVLTGEIKVIHLAENSGAAKARNAGIAAARGRYLCFIDADDLWKTNKLERQIRFMAEAGAAFAFTGYEFADAAGRPNGKVVQVPATITYRQALRNTTISTITVMFDLRKLSKNDILMPEIESEDTATWWNVLKKVKYAYGLNEPLSYYRRTTGTLSANKLVAIRRIWRLYREHERLNIMQSSANFVGYAFNAVRRRV